jgi:phage-related holin
MENLFRYLSGAAMAAAGFFAPVGPLVLCGALFVAIDFVTGIMAGRRRAMIAGLPWGFESGKAWCTVRKLCFIMAGIVLAWMIDTLVLDFMNLRLANLFTGFVCGVEFWSYLENAAEISGHPVFRHLKRYMKKQVDKAIDNAD